MTKRYAKETYKVYDGDDRIISIDFEGLLDEGETLTGTPTVQEDADTPSLTITEEQVNTTEIVIKRRKVAVGQAVLFRLDRGSADVGDYEIDVTVATSAGQTLPGSVKIECV